MADKKSAVKYMICSVDGSRLYKSEHEEYPYVFSLQKNGRPDLDKFDAVLDDNLDIRYLCDEVYSAHSSEMQGRHMLFQKDKKRSIQGTVAIIQVTFAYAINNYEHKGKGRYWLADKEFDASCIWEDHVCLGDNGELLGIEVINQGTKDKKDYAPVLSSVDDGLLSPAFEYDEKNKVYRLAKKSGSKNGREGKTTHEIREYLYREGFTVDGIHYVRYKRSAGSGRDGSCLFIAEPLYEDMMRWSCCGIDGAAVADQASWQAYISLTLSSIIGTVQIPREAIMLLPDAEVKGSEEVICIERGEEENGETVSLRGEKKTVEYTNKIWDGEALLDESVFEAFESKNADETKHGMMLLRNRMFKTCAFRTRLQKYFCDRGIRRVSDLGGYAPYAKSVADIKLVITESSIKYIKMLRSLCPQLTAEEAFKKWLDVIYGEKGGKVFGIVKQDKKSGPMDNTCVYTNYQLINTLALNRQQTEALLQNSLDLLHKIQKDPLYLRYQSKILAVAAEDGEDEHTEDGGEVEAKANYRFELIRELLARSDSAFRLSVYKEYRKDLTDSFKKRLKKGRLIVEGNYETLFGNPLEFLYRTADKNFPLDEPIALLDGEIYTRRFEDGKTLLCARSPHITMGNVLVAKNRYVAEIDEYFCLGDACAVVCVNAIKSNIQQRLNGCDYDSDTVLITDDPVMLSAALPLREKFPVPYCGITEGKKTEQERPDLCDLDIKISNNQVGEIVNLSLYLNCLYWDKASKGASEEELADIYTDICKLAVLSGIEIDRAKRDMKVSATRVLGGLRKQRKPPATSPAFYVAVTDKTGRKKGADICMDAPLSYIYDAVNADREQNSGEHTVAYSDFFSVPRVPHDQGAKRRGWNGFYEYARSVQKEISRINISAKQKGVKCEEHRIEDLLKEALEVSQKKYLKGDAEYWYALQKLEEITSENKRAYVFLYLLCFARGGLLHRISPSGEPMKDLVQDDGMTEEPYDIIYGHPHRLEDAKKS